MVGKGVGQRPEGGDRGEEVAQTEGAQDDEQRPAVLPETRHPSSE